MWFDLFGNFSDHIAKETVSVGIYRRKKGMNRAKPNWQAVENYFVELPPCQRGMDVKMIVPHQSHTAFLLSTLVSYQHGHNNICYNSELRLEGK